MGIKHLNVILDNVPASGYPPGATLTGRVIISSNERVHIRSLTLKVHGEAEVSFTDYVRRRRRRFRRIRRPNDNVDLVTNQDVEETISTEVERFTAHEEYFSTSYQILGDREISVGEQEFLFSTVLPPVLPSTFSGRFGFIRYTLKAKLDKAWNFDQVAKVEFRVAAPKDLNDFQYSIVSGNAVNTLAESLVYRGVKNFNCLCCRSGPLSLAVQLSKSGVVPGEPLQLTIEVENTTKVNITAINIMLKQETHWTSRAPRSHSKLTDETLLLMRCSGVAKRNSRSWYQPFTIPAIPYINIDVCSIIKLQHCIIVEAVAEGIHTNLTVRAPIVIGTVPIGAVRVVPEPYATAQPAQEIGFIQPQSFQNFGFVQPQSQNIGFVQSQPSAPADDFQHPEPPPPYPMSSQTFPPTAPTPNKY